MTVGGGMKLASVANDSSGCRRQHVLASGFGLGALVALSVFATFLYRVSYEPTIACAFAVGQAAIAESNGEEVEGLLQAAGGELFPASECLMLRRTFGSKGVENSRYGLPAEFWPRAAGLAHAWLWAGVLHAMLVIAIGVATVGRGLLLGDYDVTEGWSYTHHPLYRLFQWGSTFSAVFCLLMLPVCIAVVAPATLTGQPVPSPFAVLPLLYQTGAFFRVALLAITVLVTGELVRALRKV